jgi:hypothetical protein
VNSFHVNKYQINTTTPIVLLTCKLFDTRHMVDKFEFDRIKIDNVVKYNLRLKVRPPALEKVIEARSNMTIICKSETLKSLPT